MKKYGSALAAWLMLWIPLAAGGAPVSRAPLEIGVLPHLSPRAMVNSYRPLQRYMEERLKRPVLIVTAPNFRRFVERTLRQVYPVVITAPHFGRLAQRDAGYIPMLIGARRLNGVLVAAKGGAIRRIGDLAGKSVATPDPLALMTMLGKTLLRAHGLAPGRDVMLRHYLTHTSAALSVLRGENAAAIIGHVSFDRLPAETRRRLRVVATTIKVPHMQYMASPALPPREVARLRRIMLDFVEKTSQGRAFMKRFGDAGGWRRPTQRELATLDPYAREVRTLLKAAP